MKRTGWTMLASTLISGLLVLSAVPASAGDFVAPRSPVGSWRTSTNGVVQTITFTEDGNVSGDSGCNRFVGGYRTQLQAIVIGPLASTMMACEQKKMDAEATFLVRLQAAVSYTATARVLRLHTPKDLVRFVAQ